MNVNEAGIDVGLVGFGLAGRVFHAPMISAVAGMRLAAIVQRSGVSASEMYPGVRIVPSVDELLAIESIRLVVIATPNTTHFGLARQCLLAGRDVIVDKPFTTTYADAAELVRLAKDRERLLSVYQNRRWDGDFKTVREIVSGAALGRLVSYESYLDRFRPRVRGSWREQEMAGSGMLFDLGPHLIDQALVLFREPETVWADVRMERDRAFVDDAFDLVMQYPGMRVHLRANMLSPKPGPRFVLRGTEASYIKFGVDPQEDALKSRQQPVDSGWGAEPRDAWGKIYRSDGQTRAEQVVETLAGDYRGYYENVRDAMLGKRPLAVTPEQALRVMRVLELAVESSREGRVVKYS
jgi:scyllo-inositol 2-dehydrogenase (NADP+)